MAWRNGHAWCCCVQQRCPLRISPSTWELGGGTCANGSVDTSRKASERWRTGLGRVVRRFFPPEVATHLVKIACEMPDKLGRSLSQWDCTELARQLIADRIVDHISARTVDRILNHHKLKPWRIHYWQGAKTPRDAALFGS